MNVNVIDMDMVDGGLGRKYHGDFGNLLINLPINDWDRSDIKGLNNFNIDY